MSKTDLEAWTFAQAMEAVREFFKDDEKFIMWWATANPNLGYLRPLDLIIRGRTKRLIQFIQNSRDGFHE